MFVKVKVHPESKEEKIVEKGKDSLEIFIKEKTGGGEANKRVTELVAQYFNIGGARLVKGHRRRNKIFEV